MIKVLTNEEMRDLDSLAINQYGIPGIVLMENASIGVYKELVNFFGAVEKKNVFIFAGKGNNAGDGYALARHLYNNLSNVFVFNIFNPSELNGDALTNYNILKKISEDKLKIDHLHLINIKSIEEILSYPQPDLIIDAIFGTGVKGDIEGLAKDVISFCNKSNVPKIAIDIPSGLNGSSGKAANVTIKADLTITMALPKVGLLINDGPKFTGELRVVDISIPEHLLFNNKCRTYLLKNEDISIRLPKREYDSYKYSVGKVFVLAGSRGLTGAAALASEAALLSGAGAVILGIPESLNIAMESKLTEVMTLPLPETPELTLSVEALDTIIQYVSWSDVTLIGPGISQNKETKKLILSLMEKINKPLVIDADGLNNLQDNVNLLRNYKNDIIITPHYGELSRLINLPPFDIAFDRVSIARSTAKDFNLTIILKGAPTVIADKNLNVYINSTGNSGMATAGSGDVLSGLVAGFYAQTKNSLDSSILAVYLHGLAGDIAKNNLTQFSLLATDILKNINNAIKGFM